MNVKDVVEKEYVVNVRDSFHLSERFLPPQIEMTLFDFTWNGNVLTVSLQFWQMYLSVLLDTI